MRRAVSLRHGLSTPIRWFAQMPVTGAGGVNFDIEANPHDLGAERGFREGRAAVVITATFVGYLVAGFWGSLASTIGIFFPSFLLVLIAAPLLARHRGNPNVQGFVKGAYAAAIGTILGACILLARIAIGDW